MDLMNTTIKVIKKHGNIVGWNFEKIVNAVTKSANRAGVELSEDDFSELEFLVTQYIGADVVTVKELHSAVEQCLEKINPDVAKSYRNYRNYKTEFVYLWDEVYHKSKNVLYLGDKENANFNSTLSSTKGSLIRGYLTKELYKKFELSPEEMQAIEEGFIYIHDIRDLIFNGINCCLFDMKTVLKGGFIMSGIKYKEPKSVLSALQVIGDVTLVATAQQFGGFTIPEIDKLLVPYVHKTIKMYSDEAEEYGIKHADEYVSNKVHQELIQGFQSLEMKLNTVPCSRGDTAFTTLSFGNVDGHENKIIQRSICSAILEVRQKGQGNGSPVVFPKLVYLHSEKQHEEDAQNELFNKAIECSSKAMYPDFLSLDNSYVGDIFNRTGKVVSPMGCRAYLSDYIDPFTGESVFEGRANIGAVSLNLPMIWKKSEGKEFLKDLSIYLEMIRSFLDRRYYKVAQTKCSTNPLAFTQGGLYQGFKQPNDEIGLDIVKSFTASFGITSLNELNVLMEGKQLHESDQKLIKGVIQYISDRVDAFKSQDGWLYALYATPAESLAGTQLQQFRSMYGVIDDVSDREYFSNGFHCHVSADITPFEKQDHEHDLFHMINGGHIQYVRLDNNRNKLAIRSIVKRGMKLGFYQGINFDLVSCEECGYHPKSIVDVCPECDSDKITVIERTCGYLGVFRQDGETRFNDSKYAEIKDRISM